jgi:hypothetical protein
MLLLATPATSVAIPRVVKAMSAAELGEIYLP